MSEAKGKAGSLGVPERDFPSESSLLVKKDTAPDEKRKEKFRKWTLFVSAVTLVGLLFLGIYALVDSFLYNSSASFAFALGALLDCCSSAVVLWRYLGSASVYSKSKEKNACLILGILFITSAVIISIKGSLALVNETKPGTEISLFIIAHVSAVFCVILCIAKTILAVKLSSISIATDAVNSAIGALLALSTLTSEYVYEADHNIWQVDHISSIACSIILLGYGIWILVYELRIDNENHK